jgi:hypothetical protein
MGAFSILWRVIEHERKANRHSANSPANPTEKKISRIVVAMLTALSSGRIDGTPSARKSKQLIIYIKYFFAALLSRSDVLFRVLALSYISIDNPPVAIEIISRATIAVISCGVEIGSFRAGTTRSRERIEVTDANK